MGIVVMGLFDEQQPAVRAQAALQAIGIATNQMSLMNQTEAEIARSHKSQGDNWWERLKEMLGFGVDHEDLPYYHEGLRRGGTLLTVHTDESRENEVAGIFADYNAVDIDTRAQEWQNAGWSPDKQMAIPVVEEEFKVGKRRIRRGGVRVYSSVTEKPIEESVTLREEHVEVTRRPVDRAATASDMEATDTPIEFTETAEEPVVSKQAKVVEEVVVQKAAEERTETVKDTVRRKDVDVKKAS